MNVRVFAERGIVRHLCDGQRHFRSNPRARFECAYEGRCNGTCRNGEVLPLECLSVNEELALGITVPVESGMVLMVDCLADFEIAVYDDRVRVPRSRAERAACVLKEGESEVIRDFAYSVVGVVRLVYRPDFNIVITNQGGRAFATYEEIPYDLPELEPGEPLFDDEWDYTERWFGEQWFL